MRRGILREREKLELLNGALFACLLQAAAFTLQRKAALPAATQDHTLFTIACLGPAGAFLNALKAGLADVAMVETAIFLARILDGEIFDLVHCGS